MRTARRSTTPTNSQATSGVVYARPSTELSVAIADAGLGQTTVEYENDDDTVVRDDTLADFLIAVDDLVFDDVRSTPAEGDRITVKIQHDDGDPHAAEGTAHVETAVFEVCRPPNGELAWRYTDPFRTTYRIHAKRVRESADELEWTE